MAKKGENIHKRKDGRWEGRYIKGRSDSGKPVWGYLYGHAYSEVKAELIRKKALSGYCQISGSSMSFSVLAELWLNSFCQSIKESTLTHYKYTLHRYLLPVLGHLQVSSLDAPLLERLVLKIMVPDDGSHKPLGTSCAQECLGMVRRICRYAVHLHLMPPVELNIRLPQRQKTASKPLNKAEQARLKAFLLAAPSSRKAGVLLQMELGLRIGEICGLKWGDFDLDRSMLTVRRTVCRVCSGNGHTKLVVQSPKTRSSMRELPLSKSLTKLLRNLRGTANDAVWFLSGSETRPVEPRCYRKSIHSYLKQAALRTVHPHLLRHTFATTCLQAGCDIKTLSELLGHSSAAITLQCYVHSDLEQKRKALERVNAYLKTIYEGSVSDCPCHRSAHRRQKAG